MLLKNQNKGRKYRTIEIRKKDIRETREKNKVLSLYFLKGQFYNAT